MSTPLEIVITKRNALALIQEYGWTIKKIKGMEMHCASKEMPLGGSANRFFASRKKAIEGMAQWLLRSDTPRPVRVQF